MKPRPNLQKQMTQYTPSVYLDKTKSGIVVYPGTSCHKIWAEMPEQVKLYFLRSKKKQKTDKRKSYQMTHCLKTFTEAINSSYLMEIRLRWDIFPKVF